MDEMAAKHPHPQEYDLVPTLPPTAPPKSIFVDETVEALESFPVGSSGGLNGLTAQHILDKPSVGSEIRRVLLANLVEVCDIVALGTVHADARDIVYASWLIAAAKPSGGLRPIAIGNTLRRLTAKILLARVRASVSTLLSPRQLGCAARGGSEIAVHSVRTYLHGNERSVSLKVDFKNAFNSYRPDTMLKEVHAHTPEIYPMVAHAYSLQYRSSSRIESRTSIVLHGSTQHSRLASE